jgi:glutaminyl-peptide cyclotransferase
VRLLVVLGLGAAAAAGAWSLRSGGGEVPVYGFERVKAYPHDPAAYCQGLLFLDGKLYESTGRLGTSSLREVELETGDVLRRKNLPRDIFGEGLVSWQDHLIQLTWKSRKALVWKRATFEKVRELRYADEGWGLTTDGESLILSNGGAELRFLDPESFMERRRVTVTRDGRAVSQLNELEYVDGEVWANVWQTDRIVRIDPKDGKVRGVIDLTGLADFQPVADTDAVLNGIAWDAKDERLFVTGKLWPKLYEIRLVEREPAKEGH